MPRISSNVFILTLPNSQEFIHFGLVRIRDLKSSFDIGFLTKDYKKIT